MTRRTGTSSDLDTPISDEARSLTSSVTPGVLKMAWALGNRQALLDAEPRQRVITFHLGKDVAGGLKKPMEVLT